MNAAQRRALARIVRYYRRNEGTRYSIRFEMDAKHCVPGGRQYVTVRTRWDGESNRMGAEMEARGTFGLGMRGGITAICCWHSHRDVTAHVAFCLGAKLGYGHKGQLHHRPRRGKTLRVWQIADANADKSRAEILALCAAERLNPNMAKTQYSRWAKFNRR